MKKNTMYRLAGGLILLAILLFLFAYQHYQKADASQQLVEEMKAEVEAWIDPHPQQIIRYNAQGLTEEVPSSIRSEGDPMQRRIDFDQLLSMSQDATRWIYLPDTGIDYPVMQERVPGEYFYLWRDIYGQPNDWGSILTPQSSDPSADMGHLLIFGHRTTLSKYAFSELPKYDSSEYMKEHPYVYLYYPDRVERWKVWTGFQTVGRDMVYRIPYHVGSDRYQELLDWITSRTVHQLANTPDNNTKVLALSTCDPKTWGDDQGRYLLTAVPDLFYYYDLDIYTAGVPLEQIRPNLEKSQDMED